MKFKKLLHKILVFRFLVYISALFLYALVRLIQFTCKTEVIRPSQVIEYEAGDKPLIYASWHGRMFPMPSMRPKHRKINAVVSLHGDGELITKVLSFFGMGTVRGSTNRTPGESKKGFPAKDRGGSRVIRDSIKVLESGESIAITPDGPRGPRFVFKPNFINVAAITKTPIVTISFSCSNTKIFRSWDRFMLPLPFSTIKIVYGDLKFIPEINSDDDLKKHGKELETALNKLTSELDGEFKINLN